MVMLDMVARTNRYANDDLVVAHFDHGIRQNSREDAEFVRRKAAEYGLEFQCERAELGKNASEAAAREQRYDFLHRLANEKDDGHGVEIWTAHHLDDLVETVTINFWRGTGWRGLASLDTHGVRRPFLETELIYEPMDKAAIFEYAAKRRLEYREDPSNSWDDYLRNRLRQQLNEHPLDFEQKMAIYQLWQRQKQLKKELDQTVNSLLPEAKEKWERGWFRALNDDQLARSVAMELLRAGTIRAGVSATRPQLENFRRAILEYLPGKTFNLPGDKLVKLAKAGFEL